MKHVPPASAALLLALLVLGSAAAVAAGSATDGGDPPRSHNRTDGLAFSEVSDEVGFDYTNDAGVKGMMSNAGVFAADYDNDGWTDLLAVGGGQPALFRNDDGTFERTGRLPRFEGTVRSALFFDHDNDGREDLLLLPLNGTPVFLENDGGTFRRRDVGIDADLRVAMGATAGDYDGDGCPDVFIIQNGDWDDRLPAGEDDPGRNFSGDNGNPNLLYRGTCGGGFVNATAGAGIRGDRWSLATSMVDLDGDGRPDIHVANDFNNDVVYWNEGNGTFTLDVLGERTDRNGMSSEVADLNRDGRPDLFVTNIYFPRSVGDLVAGTFIVGPERALGNNLLVNRGGREFAFRGEEFGLAEGGWGWAAVAADLDNDGDVEVVHTTMDLDLPRGFGNRRLGRLADTYPYYTHPAVFERTAGGAPAYRPADPGPIGIGEADGRGMAALDYDNDGDLDLAIATAAASEPAAYQFYENRASGGGALQVELRSADGAPALGSRVAVTVGNRTLVEPYNARADYLSQDARTLHFGVGNGTRATVRIVWPDGTEATFRDVAVGQRLVVSRSGIERRVPLGGEPSRSGALRRPGPLAVPVLSLVLAGLLLAAYWGYRRS